MIYKSKNLSLKTRKSGPKGVHFVVSKKVAPTAVKRNLLKKRARAATYNFLGKRENERSLVFYFEKTATTLSFLKLKVEIMKLLKKAKI